MKSYKALYQVSDGFIIIPEVKSPYSDREQLFIDNVEWSEVEYGEDLKIHIVKRHCFVFEGSIEILPESEWPESSEESVS